MSRDYSYLVDTLSGWNFTLTDRQIEQLDLFYELLVEKNKVMNLTAITEFDEVIVKHFADSLSICTVLPDSVKNVCDLGTGAGFPGIPMAIAYPNLQFTLIDSLNKRIKFLQEVVDALGLTNVTLVHARAEEAGRNKLYREKFDLVVSRAVANIATLSEYCLPLVNVGGYFISFKSGDVKEEIETSGSAVKKLGGNLTKPVYFSLPDTDISRSFLIIKKEKNTPKAYPRKAGTPSKEPLK
ncbi:MULTISPECIES: 16S rRNA (guanine(527)-N(7))-methyltransferase RsmG [Pseudobutyrivibrio]|uniref:Ribosomal RNA small subunit methyltransferase G n=1 Tax=Pseudobutyrivibrio xylanivorans TaxID=185007 RepID=A0A1G5S2P8_PSEXY|nr:MULTISPECIES: 16S rRNA (guanine(527)-N(7))-methyltransferase RsmG [Pseudobutyrivibrio]MDC7279220.1 16S rRNA (guanine(527)-N(7))-methyltransferase RsmG [Butyrivibrio fibrisolvens]SCZ80644.1 16S rRNA (guanine527-N7)-methyltransferase [Pseudobutyrivibrio xylanivorans]